MFHLRLIFSELSAIVYRLLDETKEGREFNLCRTLHLRLNYIAKFLDKNLFEIKKSCWECGKEHERNYFECAGCEAACYCGEDCQNRAWQGGHKKKCLQLGKVFNMFHESIEVIETLHLSGEDNSSGLSKVSDYCVLICTLAKGTLSESVFADKYQTLKGPSIKIFYENFKRVQRGDLWYVAQPDDSELYLSKLALGGPDAETLEYKVFSFLLYALSINFLGFVPPDGETQLPLELCRIFHKLGPVETLELRMPATRFFEIYRSLHPDYNKDVEEDGPEWTKRKCCLIKGAACMFKECFHK